MAIRTTVPILAHTVVATRPIATTGVPRAAATAVVATDEALSMSVATLNANMSSGATAMGAIAVAAVIRMEAAITATAIIRTEAMEGLHTEVMEGLGAMATAVSGAVGHRRISAVMEHTPADMRRRRGHRSLFQMRATTTRAATTAWKTGLWSVGAS